MQQKEAVLDCYNRTSGTYAERFINELDHKPLDSWLLQRFVTENASRGKMIDLGCGPGQTTQFLHRAGVRDLVGIDLSPGMVTEARQQAQNQITFEEGNMLDLSFPNDTIGSAVCFYGIVHFTYPELEKVFAEIKRVLQPGGQFLFSFHIGDEVNRVEEFLGQAVNEVAFHFFEVDHIRSILEKLNWTEKEIIERHPYEAVEFPSKRAYVWLEKENG